MSRVCCVRARAVVSAEGRTSSCAAAADVSATAAGEPYEASLRRTFGHRADECHCCCPVAAVRAVDVAGEQHVDASQPHLLLPAGED